MDLRYISIHAPLAGSDLLAAGFILDFLQFQSTLPSRGATLHEAVRRFLDFDFNPRSPRGERPADTSQGQTAAKFQSTLPSRGATAKMHKIICAFQQLYTKLSLSIEL